MVLPVNAIDEQGLINSMYHQLQSKKIELAVSITANSVFSVVNY